MAFAYTITNKMLMPPAQKRSADSGNVWRMWGTYTNTSGGTGGAIVTGFTRILDCGAIDSVGANAIKVEPNVAANGQITITTTADDDGRWWAVGKY